MVHITPSDDPRPGSWASLAGYQSPIEACGLGIDIIDGDGLAVHVQDNLRASTSLDAHLDAYSHSPSSNSSSAFQVRSNPLLLHHPLLPLVLSSSSVRYTTRHDPIRHITSLYRAHLPYIFFPLFPSQKHASRRTNTFAYMASRPETYGSIPPPAATHQDRGYGLGLSDPSHLNNGTSNADFATGNNTVSSPIAASLSRPTSFVAGEQYAYPDTQASRLDRSASRASATISRDPTPSRSGTLKKRVSVSRKSSLKRSGSRKSISAGSIKGVGFAGDAKDYNSAFFTPIPTAGNPTEILANRFQAWRTLLKSIITYFREVQASYDHRSKALAKVSNVITNIQHPSVFMTTGGLADASRVLADYHRHSLAESNKSKDIQADVIQALSGLRSDLAQKIKEIKSLHGDFKNTVEKEKDNTKRAMTAYTEALHDASHNDASKNDPFLVRLNVDRSIERQIDEENYLHRAYLNLETSGRELEAIVVGEIQKAYNAIAGILKREGDDAYHTVDELRTGPIAMPKDMEWDRFVENDPNFVNPRLPIRRVEDIDYPGKSNPEAAEIRAGMLERKSKYLKSYTPGWYVLSPTHLHEFKSADKIYSQPPVMSLYLPDQKLGSHSAIDSSSHKFMLKGRQSGGVHRGHAWVFRAESYDTMLAWFEAITALTEKTGEERDAFVRQHARNISDFDSNGHRPASLSSDGLEEDEADQVPYSAASSVINAPVGVEDKPTRPLPGGRFPSDLNVNRNREVNSPSTESEPDRDTITAVGALSGAAVAGAAVAEASRTPQTQQYPSDPYRLQGISSETATPTPVQNQYQGGDYASHPVSAPQQPLPQQIPASQQQALQQPASDQYQPRPAGGSLAQPAAPVRQNTNYGEWFGPAAAGAGVGVLGAAAYNHHQKQDSAVPEEEKPEAQLTNPETGNVVPIPTTTNTVAHSPQPVIESTRALNEEPVSTAPIATGVSAMPTASMPAASAGTFNSNAGLSGESTNISTLPHRDVSSGDQLGGLEKEGARGTGSFFPSVIRHDTDMSVSQLHVPGEFPPQTPGVTKPPGATKPISASTLSHWDLVRE